MADMTENDPTSSAPPAEEPSSPRDGESSLPRDEEPDASSHTSSPEVLAETGEAVGDDGSVVPIIGGLPAVEGSAWDIGAPRDERGAGLAEKQGGRADED
jgi:hypothetical protein